MNFPFFITSRVAASGQKSFARLIIRIAIAAVALSIAVMIIANALIKGFKSEISDKMFSFWGHIHITSAQQTTTYEPIPITANQSFLPTLKNLKALPDSFLKTERLLETAEGENTEGVSKPSFGGIKHVQVYATKAGIIKTKDNFEGIILKGVGTDFNWSFINQYILEGRQLSPCAIDSCNEILISKSTADRLNLKLNGKFIVHFVQNNAQEQRLFQIVGIYKTGLEEYDKKFALVDIQPIQKLLGWSPNQIAGYEVFVDDIRDLNRMNNFIYNELISNQFSAQTIRQEQPSIFEWLDLQDVNEKVILGLMLLVGIINMVTALLILILERTSMIGTLKSLGSSNWSIQCIFLYYGAIIICIGLLIGNVVGIGLAFLEQKFKFIKLSEADYYLSYAPIKFDIFTILSLNLGTLAITTLFLLLPTLLVLSISPVKAIQFK
ncbi:MAG: FtsX-like permease family protein [Saprospiraceae bacterium]|nr:FtsX-like permease family protein [Saprospiraceae bacterium]